MLALPQLDLASNEPIYRQLYAELKRRIESRELAAGQKLPPTRELAGQLGLNRATVAAAYEMLEADGLLRGHVGRGSFVAAPPAPEQRHPLISFATARPAEDLFPIDEFRASCDEVIRGPEAAAILQLGSPFGYAPLRGYLSEQGRRQGVVRASDDLLITSGCQQALDLLHRQLTQPGDTVLIEDPIYPGLRNAFARGGVRALGVRVTDQGVDVDAAARLIARERPRLVVVTPNFQNPTGTTMPLDARLALLAAARDSGAVVVENDIYGELRYEGEPVASLKQLDETGAVVQIKSFSKLAFPGLRVGWITGPRALVSHIADWKLSTDLHSDQLSQAVLLRFAESGRLDAHRRRMIRFGAERLRAVTAACARHLPAGSSFTLPQGGMNLWVRLPAPLDTEALLEKAHASGVSYLPGRHFAVARPEASSLRLSFAQLRPEMIEAGLALLGRLFSSELKHSGGARATGLEPAVV